MIKIRRSNEKRIAIMYPKNLGIILIFLYWFVIQITYRRKSFDAIEQIDKMREMIKERMNRKCKVCGEKLNVTSFRQEIFYHKDCRKLRNVKPIKTT